MTLVNAFGQVLAERDPATVAYLLSQGASLFRDDGSQAVVLVYGGQWNPASIYIDGQPLATFLNPPAVIPPPAQPPGTIPPSNGVFGSSGRPFRLIFPTAPGRVDTGATYAGCSQANPQGCQPQQFATIQDAYDYAAAHNEVPHLVGSVAEAWDIVEGRKKISETNWGILAAGALAVWYFVKKKRS